MMPSTRLLGNASPAADQRASAWRRRGNLPACLQRSSSARTCNRHHFAKVEECVTATGREERQLCCWLPRYVMACRYFDAEANLVTIHVEASKCRQSALNHRVRRRQTDAEIIRGVHDAAGQHEDITIGKPVPLALGISFGPFDPQIERALRQ